MQKFIRKYGTPLAILAGCGVIAAAIYLSVSRIGDRLFAEDSPKEGDAGSEVRLAVSVDDDPALGKSDAPVIMIEFSDFQCPFCRKFWRESFAKLKTEYIDKGLVKFVYRDFPLPIHPAALKAAEAAECADEQGKFWEYHDKIFMEQDKKGQGTIEFGEADLKNWAREIGLLSSGFDECLASGKYEGEARADLADGGAAGVDGTPTFFINGLLVKGSLPLLTFIRILDQELAKK